MQPRRRRTGMEQNKALSYIGIARKAGKLAIGTPNVCDAMRRQADGVVFASSDASEATKKRLYDKCTYYGVRLCTLKVSGEELAHLVGKTGQVAAVMITDGGLTAAAVSAYDA